MDERGRDQPTFLQRVAIVAAVVILLLGAWYAADVLLLLFGGLLLAIFLRGLAALLSKLTRLPAGWSLAVVIIVLFAASVAGVWFLSAEIATQFDELSRRMTAAWIDVRQYLSQYSWGQRVLEFSPFDSASGRSDILSRATMIVTTGLGALANIVIILFIGIYGAASPQLYRGGLLRLVPPSRRDRAAEVIDTVAATLRRWLVGRLINMAIVGVATLVGLLILGIPLAPALALIAFVLDFVPYIGPIVAVIPAAAVAFTESPMDALYVGGLYLGIQTVESYLLQPLIQQHNVELPPVLTITAQTLMGVLFGTLGIVFATPLAAAAMVLVKMLYVQDVLGDPIEVKFQTRKQADSS